MNVCLNVWSDVNNCGECRNKCFGRFFVISKCSEGKCFFECDMKNGRCDCGGCKCNSCEVNIMIDKQNCGRCENVCFVGVFCVGGVCVFMCVCGFIFSLGICVDLSIIVGVCGNVCFFRIFCISRVCVCIGGFIDCLG